MTLARLLLPPGPGFADAAAAVALEALAPSVGEALAPRMGEPLAPLMGAPAGDLSGGVILLPTLNAGPAMRTALARAAAARGLTAFLPPRIETLETWLERAPLQASVESRAARTAGLYRLLKARGWYGGDPPWETVHALLALADELSLHLNAAGDEPRLARAIEAHYRAGAARVAGEEAQLVLEVWRAYAKPQAGAALDPGLARRLREQAWVRAINEGGRQAPAGIVWLTARSSGELPAHEARFARALGECLPVHLVAPQGLTPLLEAAWGEEGASLQARARSLPAADFESARLTVRAAHSLEQEATLAAAQVMQWLSTGKRRIAIVAFDRLTARRMRALLERRQILLADESGWKLSTTSAATCAMRWVEVATGGFRQRDVLDWLKSPHVFAAHPAPGREAAVALLEAAIREHNVLAGAPAMRKALASLDDGNAAAQSLAQELLDRMEAAARPWARRAATLAEWSSLLAATLDELDAAGALRADAAGKAVLDLLQNLTAAVESPDAPRYAVTEWRAWLAAELEAATFRDAAIDSPVALTTLRAAVLREFEAVLLVGAGADHLPGEAAPGPLLTPRLRAELGLSTREESTRAVRDELALVLAAAPVAAATWRASEGGDPNPLSPFLSRLDALYQAAGLRSLIVEAAPAAKAEPADFDGMPAPAAPQLLPRRVSVSAYGSLITCPYQFFARHLLGLNEQDQVREEFEKRDYGEWVHRLLRRFHGRYPRLTGVAREELLQTLAELAEDEFAAALEFNYLSLGWKLRWEAMARSYIEWQLEREAAGWHWQSGETRGEIHVDTRDGEVLLHGRLDRIDTDDTGRVEVLDYKTQSVDSLRAKVRELGEDVQLAVYALSQAEAGECSASFVSVDGDAVRAVPANDGHLPEDEWRRITQLFNAVGAGAGLPANGVEAACKYCEMRGLCRHDVWAGEGEDA